MRRKWLILLVLLLAGTAGGGYLLYKQFLRDRDAAMVFQERPPERPSFGQERRLPDGRTVRTYTAKDLEEARKKGKPMPGVPPTGPSQATTANDAAVQRTLRTIEEINRINEMNRRLQEQQQRTQKQK